VTVKTAASKLGTILVDSQGRTLYAFTQDSAGTPTCDGACADAWPPVAAKANTTVGGGVDAALLSMVPRADHTSQLKVGKWPVYLYAGDGAPGDVNGEGSGGTWFVLAPDGSLIKG
jgi:predicted lipoprotein with Yx(FWY)xxD motif